FLAFPVAKVVLLKVAVEALLGTYSDRGCCRRFGYGASMTTFCRIGIVIDFTNTEVGAWVGGLGVQRQSVRCSVRRIRYEHFRHTRITNLLGIGELPQDGLLSY